MKNKRGVGLAIGRVLVFILLLAVLALVIYGISTGGINLLAERLGGIADSVLIKLGLMEADGGGYAEYIDDDFEILNLSGKLTCTKESAKIDFKQGQGSYEYNYNKKKLGYYDKGKKEFTYGVDDEVFDSDAEKFRSLVRQLLEKKENLCVDFEERVEGKHDYYIGITSRVEWGLYGFGRDYDGEEKQSSVWLWYYDESAGWVKITREDITSMSSGNEKDYKWNLHAAFRDTLKHEENVLEFSEQKFELVLIMDRRYPFVLNPKDEMLIGYLHDSVEGYVAIGKGGEIYHLIVLDEKTGKATKIRKIGERQKSYVELSDDDFEKGVWTRKLKDALAGACR